MKNSDNIDALDELKAYLQTIDDNEKATEYEKYTLKDAVEDEATTLFYKKQTLLHAAFLIPDDDLNDSQGSKIGRQDLVETLLECKADVNAADELGNTPLLYAVVAGDTKMVELLLNYGANVSAVIGKGVTPLQQASYKDDSQKGNKEVLELLQKHNLNANNNVKPTERVAEELQLQRGAFEVLVAAKAKGEEGPEVGQSQSVSSSVANSSIGTASKNAQNNNNPTDTSAPIVSVAAAGGQNPQQASAQSPTTEMDVSDNKSTSTARPSLTGADGNTNNKPDPSENDIKWEKYLAAWLDYAGDKASSLQSRENYKKYRDEIFNEVITRTGYNNIPGKSASPTSDYLGFPKGEDTHNHQVFTVQNVEINIAFDASGKMYLSKESLKKIQANKLSCYIKVDGKNGNTDEYLEFREGKLFIIDHGPHAVSSLIGGKRELLEEISGRSLNRQSVGLSGSASVAVSSRNISYKTVGVKRKRETDDNKGALPQNESGAGSEARNKKQKLAAGNVKNGVSKKVANPLVGKDISNQIELAKLGLDLESEIAKHGVEINELKKIQAHHNEEKQKFDLERKEIFQRLEIRNMNNNFCDDNTDKYFAKSNIRGLFYANTAKQAKNFINNYGMFIPEWRKNSASIADIIENKEKELTTLQQEKNHQTIDSIIVGLLVKHYGDNTAGIVVTKNREILQSRDLIKVYLENRQAFRKELGYENVSLENIENEEFKNTLVSQVAGKIRAKVNDEAYKGKGLNPEEIEKLKKLKNTLMNAINEEVGSGKNVVASKIKKNKEEEKKYEGTGTAR